MVYHLCSFTGLPPLVLRRILEIFTYLATNHTAVSDLLFYFDPLLAPECSDLKRSNNKKGKEKMVIGGDSSNSFISSNGDVPLVTFLKLLSQPVFTRSIAHLEQVCFAQIVTFLACPCVTFHMFVDIYIYLCHR